MKLLTIRMLIVLNLLLAGCAGDGAAPDAAPVDAAATTESATPLDASPAAASAAPAAAPAPAAPVAKMDAPAAPRSVTVPAGTPVNVIMVDALSSATNKAGDQFTATLAEPIMINGKVVLDRGTKVQGRVVDVEGSGRVRGKANMRLVLTGFVLGGKNAPVVTETLYTEAEGTKARDAAIVGGGAGIGAAIGAIAGGKGGAGTGAIIGSAAGAGTVLATKGEEVEFPSESKVGFKLLEAAVLPL